MGHKARGKESEPSIRHQNDALWDILEALFASEGGGWQLVPAGFPQTSNQPLHSLPTIRPGSHEQWYTDQFVADHCKQESKAQCLAESLLDCAVHYESCKLLCTVQGHQSSEKRKRDCVG